MSETETIESDGYQITVVNIRYGNEFSGKRKDRPDMVTLDVPEALLKTRNKGDNQKFLDTVEAFAYNTVTRKYGAEVTWCQVFLPLEENS